MRQLILLIKVRMEKTKKVVIKQNQLLLPITSSRPNKTPLVSDQSVQDVAISQARLIPLGESSHRACLQV